MSLFNRTDIPLFDYSNSCAAYHLPNNNNDYAYNNNYDYNHDYNHDYNYDYYDKYNDYYNDDYDNYFYDKVQC